VRHLHDFVRETKLTEAEFQQACSYIATLGRLTNDSHNTGKTIGKRPALTILNRG
jgi:catechol 1,2-dioxygenase